MVGPIKEPTNLNRNHPVNCSHATYFVGPMDQYFHEVSPDGEVY